MLLLVSFLLLSTLAFSPSSRRMSVASLMAGSQLNIHFYVDVNIISENMGGRGSVHNNF